MTGASRFSEETFRLLRRWRIEYRNRPAVYRDLLVIAYLVEEIGCADTTGFAGQCSDPGSSSEMTPSQVAARLGVTPEAVRKACRTGRLKAVKPAGAREWRISAAAYVEYRNRAA
ncbi:helix-turn-helix domain-containing protein [Actinomadura nitritigenes]|uniref:helix-turn-helix domain-containing protein n=1 Tax=Actinomadura nitritigenes TaxID=134602 RepID=UPI003D93237F